MPSVLNRCSVTTTPFDQLLIEELADLTGQSISAVASAAISEWLRDHYVERRKYYIDALHGCLKGDDAIVHDRPTKDPQKGRSQRLYDATGGDATGDNDLGRNLSSGFQSRIRSMEEAHTSRVSKDGG